MQNQQLNLPNIQPIQALNEIFNDARRASLPAEKHEYNFLCAKLLEKTLQEYDTLLRQKSSSESPSDNQTQEEIEANLR